MKGKGFKFEGFRIIEGEAVLVLKSNSDSSLKTCICPIHRIKIKGANKFVYSVGTTKWWFDLSSEYELLVAQIKKNQLFQKEMEDYKLYLK